MSGNLVIAVGASIALTLDGVVYKQLLQLYITLSQLFLQHMLTLHE